MSEEIKQKPKREKSLDELAIMQIVNKSNVKFKEAYLDAMRDLKEKAVEMEKGSFSDRKAAKEIRKSIAIIHNVFKTAKESIIALEDYANTRRLESANLRARQLVSDNYLNDTIKSLEALNLEITKMNGGPYIVRKPDPVPTKLHKSPDVLDDTEEILDLPFS